MSQAMRQRIQRGMLEAVGAEGYEDTSVRTVLDHSGLYRQAFYDEFESKQDCYLIALGDGLEAVERMMFTAAGEEGSWRVRTRAGIAALLEFLDAEPDVGRALAVEVYPAGSRAVAKLRVATERAIAQVDRAREEGDQDSPGIAARAVVGGLHSLIHSRLATGEEGGFAGLLPELMYLVVLPFFGPETAAEELGSGAGR